MYRIESMVGTMMSEKAVFGESWKAGMVFSQLVHSLPGTVTA